MPDPRAKAEALNGLLDLIAPRLSEAEYVEAELWARRIRIEAWEEAIVATCPACRDGFDVEWLYGCWQHLHAAKRYCLASAIRSLIQKAREE